MKLRTMPADSRIGEELRAHERALLFAGICPDCARDDSLLEVPAVCPTPHESVKSLSISPTLIKCSRCSFAVTMTRSEEPLTVVAGSAS